MTITTLLDTWRSTPSIANNIAAWRTLPARPAQTAPLPAELHPALAQALRNQGIESLYSHQAASWQKIQAGRHPVIVTGTASGKTLGYNLPVLHHLLSNPHSRALYLFPTKALTHDQFNQLSIINEQLTIPKGHFVINYHLPITIFTYDGDTPANMRPTIRNQGRIILSNPDMLHTAILPHHTKWAEFFQRLRFVVIDEMHVYRGVFGSHVANVLRRLKRIANFYGAAPQFILTSATIANPVELAESLIEETVALIDQDGAAKGPKHFCIYNPPIINPDLGLRRSALQETVRLSRELLQQNVQTIIFGRARRTVELLLRYLRETGSQMSEVSSQKSVASSQGSVASSQSSVVSSQRSLGTRHSSAVGDQMDVDDELQHSIRAYRSGYLPRQRREIERGLRDGSVRGVVATTALELGIDIGNMGAAVLMGYPGTIAATWQQAGRAGRQSEASLALLVVSANPLDQFLAHHPDYFFERAPEGARINPDNLLILLQHLRCAAFELPFQAGDAYGRVEPALMAEFLEFLQESGDLHQSNQTYFWMAASYPAESVSLRSASPQSVRLQVNDDNETARTIGDVDIASAPWLAHPQAIYLHEGQSFVVDALDLDDCVAHLRPTNVDYYTEPKRDTSVQLVEQLDTAPVRGATKSRGEIVVTTQVVGYRVVQWFTQEKLGEGDVNLPPSELRTTGYWLTLTEETVNWLREQGLWANDPNDYGPNWAAQRNQARARDGYTCQICGAPEQDRQHDVHHKIPFRAFDSYQQANQLSNLVTLCRSCHRRAEMAVRMRSGLSGLATALGHLAPLFLMCDQRDVGLHADAQSPLSQGQPSVVIYDMIPAGIGFSQRLYELHNTLIQHAYELVTACPCTDGCPSCVGPAGEDGRGGKRETQALLEILR